MFPQVINWSHMGNRNFSFTQTHLPRPGGPSTKQTIYIRGGGEWSAVEQAQHINILELKACQLTIQSFCKNTTHKHIRVFMDNSTSCSYINKFGGRTPELNSVAHDIWVWCIERNIHLSAAHVPGIQDCEADEESRTINDDREWSLRSEIFVEILQKFPKITVDLFTSRLNNQVVKYVSHRPDPHAFAIDAFTLTWSHDLFFIFPPFSLLSRILQKVEEDQTEAILVAPIWPTQSWWPSLLQPICGQCFKLPITQKILYLPYNQDKKHHLKKMNLAVFHISGSVCREKGYHGKPGTLFYSCGGHPLRLNTTVISQMDQLLWAKN